VATELSPTRYCGTTPLFSGLKEILEGSIWASSLAYLNDAQEYRYTIDMALTAFKRPNRDLGYGLTYEAVPKRVEQYFDQIKGPGVFVTCFSQAVEDLSQREITPEALARLVGLSMTLEERDCAARGAARNPLRLSRWPDQGRGVCRRIRTSGGRPRRGSPCFRA